MGESLNDNFQGFQPYQLIKCEYNILEEEAPVLPHIKTSGRVLTDNFQGFPSSHLIRGIITSHIVVNPTTIIPNPAA